MNCCRFARIVGELSSLSVLGNAAHAGDINDTARMPVFRLGCRIQQREKGAGGVKIGENVGAVDIVPSID